MIVPRDWHLNVDEDTSSIWISNVLPLIVADATIGQRFNQIFDFGHRIISVVSAAVIVDAKSEPTGTTFTLSVE